MSYAIKPLSCDPARIKGMSERLIVSHYENNYCGAVRRLNLIEEQLAELDYAKAAGYVDIFMDCIRWDNAEQLVRTAHAHAEAGATTKI
jgi:hypothetical protein